MAALNTRRGHGRALTAADDRLAMAPLIREVTPELLGGANGMACHGVGDVRNDLPPQAKPFVKRHELEPLFQTGEERNPEFAANVAAAKAYPLGLLAIMAFSLRKLSAAEASRGCVLLTLWRGFKIYCSPMAPPDGWTDPQAQG